MAERDDLDEVTSEMRAAGLAGDRLAFAQLFQAASELAACLRSAAASSVSLWRSLLRYDLETANVPAILDDLEMKISADPGQTYTSTVVKRFVMSQAAALTETRLLVKDLGQGNRLSLSTDVCIGTWFRLFLLSEEHTSSRDIWWYTVQTAIRVATNHEKSFLLLPDYAAPLVERRKFFFSFHTYGVRPDVAHFKPSDFPRRVIIDKTGYSGWSTLANAELEDLPLPSLHTAEEFFHSHKAEVLAGNISKYPQRSREAAEKFPDKFIFVALQVPTDQTQALARVPMLEMLDIVIRRFRGSEIKVVVKRHPKCADPTVTARIDRLLESGDIIVSDASIHCIIPLCVGICTVNSGVGSEAIVYLKPIYLFGEADYNCVSYKISSYEDFVLATKSGQPYCSPDKMKRFLYYYRNIYQTSIDDPTRLQAKVEQTLKMDGFP